MANIQTEPMNTIAKLTTIICLTLIGASCGDGSTQSESAVKESVATGPDPLYQYQWHLNNSGQTNFAANPGISAEDINVDSVIAEGIKGDNVIVAVVDTGLEIAHEDLSVNIVSGGSWDFVESDSDPTTSSTTGDHGTSVAGLIAATGWNGKGGRGVAPGASLKGFNFLSSETNANLISSLSGASYAADVDIFNQSFGLSLSSNSPINTYVEAQLLSGVTNLRGGKGAIYIKSAGNGFNTVRLSGTDYSCDTLYGGSTEVTCQNANQDPDNTVPYNIVVGALNAQGSRSSYSTTGSPIWVAAPGGESGSTHPAMMTTDQSSCSKGYVRTGGSSINSFNTVSSGSPQTENLSCNYTSAFNGTSSAAPVLSGVVALILESNPALTWRDVKHILASTAVQVHPSIGDTVLSINGVNHISEPQWLTNNAGYKFHNYYGFGRVDAASAVAAAKIYVSGSLGTFFTSSWTPSGALNVTIPRNSATGVSSTLAVSDVKTIESLQVKVNVTHESSGVLAVEITSPSGTKSVLMTPLNIFFSSNDLTNMVLLSNAFYGEPSNGNWTIKVVDPLTGNAGTLDDWSIRVFGH